MTTSAAKANRNADIVERLEAEIERLRAAVIKERERCIEIAEAACYKCELGQAESAWNAACEHIVEGMRALEQEAPQAFIEAKRERDDGWPDERS